METTRFRYAGVFAAFTAMAAFAAPALAVEGDTPPPLSVEYVIEYGEPNAIVDFSPAFIFYRTEGSAFLSSGPLVLDGVVVNTPSFVDPINSAFDYTSFGLFGVYTRALPNGETGEEGASGAVAVETGIAVAFVLGDAQYPLGVAFETVFADFLAANPGETEETIAQALIDQTSMGSNFAAYLTNRPDTNGIPTTESVAGDTMTIVGFSDGVSLGTVRLDILPAGGTDPGNIPEPASLTLLGLGATALLARRKR